MGAFVRFVVTGALSALVDVGGLILLHEQVGLWAPVAAVVSYLASMAVNFSLNRRWTFDSAQDRGLAVFGRYVILVVVASSLLFVAMAALTALGVPYLMAKGVLMVVFVIANFTVARNWVFASSSGRAREPVA